MSTRRDFLHQSTLLGATLASTSLFGQVGFTSLARKVRVAIVGGRFGLSFQFHEHPDCVVEAVAELRPARLAALQKVYKCTNKKSDNRKSDGREERSHLAAARTHKDDAGLDHKHHFYWVGGDLCEATLDVNGNILLTLITPDKYEMRTNRDVTRREYFTFQTTCPNTAKPLTHRVGLFHADGPSRDLVHNFGEVARVYGPSNPNFPYLYGGRNDAESRHTNLKARIKYLPTDVLGQSLRILTAMVTSNSVSYQWHLKHLGAPNQIDGVA